MIRLIAFMLWAVSYGVYATEELGLKDLSVVSIDGKMILQVDHLFLGTGNGRANITFYGCNDGVREYHIQNRTFSEFELYKCTLDDPANAYVELSFGQPNSGNVLSKYEFSSESRVKNNRVSQIQNFFSVKLRLIEEMRDGILTLHTVDKYGSCSKNNVAFSLIAGTTLYYSKWLNEGDFIKEFIVNGTELSIEHEKID